MLAWLDFKTVTNAARQTVRQVAALSRTPRHVTLAAALLLALGLAASPAVTQSTVDGVPGLHPYVPDKPVPEKPQAEKAPEKPAAAAPPPTPPAPVASTSASASKAPPPETDTAAKTAHIKPHMPVPAIPGTPAVAAPKPVAPGVAPAHPVTAPTVVAAAKPAPAAAPQKPTAPPTYPGLPSANAAKPALQPMVATAPVRNLSTPISADDIETFTDSVVRTLMQRDHVMGVTVAIVQGNTPLLLKGYGYDRLKPVTRRVDPGNSLFRIGSITKVFTWIVARQELEQGRIKMDAPIADSLPSDIFSEEHTYKPLTLRALMDHTSGYEDTSLGHLFQLDQTRLVGADSYFRVHKPKRVRDPGLFSSYSNFGAALAARALVQTGQAKDVPSLMEARIFTPLGMDHTTLREPYDVSDADLEGLPVPLSATLTQDMSEGYAWDGATYVAQPFDHAIPLAGALGGSTTAKDMARLMALMLGNGQLDGVQLFNAESAKAFRTPMLNVPEGYNGWASGLMIRTAPSGQVTYGHGGSTLWFNSNLVLVPDLNLGIFISTNTQTGGALANSFPNLLLDHLNGDLVRAPLMPTADMAYAEHKQEYDAIKGQYVSTRRAYGGLEGAITRLVNTVKVSFDTDGRLILTTPDGLSAYVPASAEGFFNQQDSEDPGPAQALGGLHFLTKPDGTHIGGFETATNMMRYERVGWIHSPAMIGLLTVIMMITCVVVFLSLAKGETRHERPTEEQSRATLISCGLAFVWLLAILIFYSWKSQLNDDATSLFTHWPSGQVRLASSLALIAALGTLYQAATFYFVYNENHRYSDGWAQWQKVSHGLLLAYWLFYIVVLAFWGALEPWSW